MQQQNQDQPLLSKIGTQMLDALTNTLQNGGINVTMKTLINQDRFEYLRKSFDIVNEQFKDENMTIGQALNKILQDDSIDKTIKYTLLGIYSSILFAQPQNIKDTLYSLSTNIPQAAGFSNTQTQIMDIYNKTKNLFTDVGQSVRQYSNVFSASQNNQQPNNTTQNNDGLNDVQTNNVEVVEDALNQSNISIQSNNSLQGGKKIQKNDKQSMKQTSMKQQTLKEVIQQDAAELDDVKTRRAAAKMIGGKIYSSIGRKLDREFKAEGDEVQKQSISNMMGGGVMTYLKNGLVNAIDSAGLNFSVGELIQKIFQKQGGGNNDPKIKEDLKRQKKILEDILFGTMKDLQQYDQKSRAIEQSLYINEQ